jgi:16S rRNA (cytosine967-C5)-methyltransferase
MADRGRGQIQNTRKRSTGGDAPIRDARDAAYRHLSAHAKRYPDLLPSEINTGSLEARDASLAIAIVDASVRRWRTLEYIIETLSGHASHEIEPRLRAVLLGGAAQLLLLDRVPPHAVLDESVSWAKRHIRPGAGGMVNAVLRKVARVRGEQIEDAWEHHLDAIPLSEGGMLRLNGVELPQHGRRRLGIACSLPNALLQRWEAMYGDPTLQALHTICKPPTILYTKHCSALSNDPALIPHASGDHHVFSGSRAELLALLDSESDLWVQDPASSATLGQLRFDSEPELAIDLCAGQGTKTRQLRAMLPNCKVIASEIDSKRLGTLQEQFSDDTLVQIEHVRDLDAPYAESADFILVDAPCSNTGVLPRRVEARYRPLDSQLKRLAAMQREILRHARELLAPGGTLIYSTCSAEIDENEAQADWASKELGLELIELARIEASGQPGDSPSAYQDGAFSARFRRND